MVEPIFKEPHLVQVARLEHLLPPVESEHERFEQPVHLQRAPGEVPEDIITLPFRRHDVLVDQAQFRKVAHCISRTRFQIVA